MLLSLSFALAGPLFATPGSAVQLDPGGNWPRSFPIEGQDKFALLNASAGKYYYQEMDLNMGRVPNSQRELSARGDELDHGITECPDGGYVHVSTATHTTPDDSVYAQRLDSTFHVIAESNPVDSDPSYKYLDPPAICTSWMWGFAGMTYEPEPRQFMEMYLLDDDGNVQATRDMNTGPDANGASFYADDTDVYAIGTRYDTPDSMWLTHFNNRLVGEDPVLVDVAPDGYVAYWYQRIIKVDDVFIVAHMMNKTSEKFDTQTGNIWLTAFDPDWNVIDQVQITNVPAPTGAFHPWVVQREDKLMVNWTYQSHNYGAYVAIDLAAADYGPDDTGTVDTGDTGDTGTVDTGDSGAVDTDTGVTDTGPDTGASDTGTPDTKEGCACDHSSGAAAAGGVAALLLVARRRR